ncbi:MAG: hypothetical protein ACI9C1_001988 [Candidatus Aldehydirespiratoraceae bacterium]|jgi:hypothetical protein
MLGKSHDNPVRHLGEHLSILMPLVRQEAVGFEGETLTANVALDIPATPSRGAWRRLDRSGWRLPVSARGSNR